MPIDVRIKKEIISLDTDEHPNRTTSLEKLAGLRPAFKPGGSVTSLVIHQGLTIVRQFCWFSANILLRNTVLNR